MIKIYHNPRCSKSRAGLQYLTDNNIEFSIVDYLKEGITKEKIQEFVVKTGLPVINLVRQHEDYYKQEMKGKDLSDDAIIDAIVANPRLLHRPIMVKGDKAVFAQPPEKVQEIL